MQGNVFFLTIDSLRADRLGCFGYRRNWTPNIDLLASEGTVFTHAYSNGPGTRFSFPSIFASSYAFMHPSKPFKHIHETGVYRPAIHGCTLARALAKVGYHTTAITSNPSLSSYFNYDSGFNEFVELLEPAFTWKESRLARYLKRFDTRPKKFDAHLMVKTAINLENADSKNKRFLWIHFMDPHRPHAVHSSLRYVNCLKRFLRGDDEPEVISDLYDGEIKYVDEKLGSYFEHLKSIGIWTDENYIMLASDHGEEFGEHGGTEHGLKLYDELLHIPLIMSGPGIRTQRVATQVELLDLSPTICRLLGIKPPESFLGENILPAHRGKERKGVISECGGDHWKSFSHRFDGWKFILTITNGMKKKELYDLVRDAKETLNVYETNKDVADAYEKILMRHIKEEDASLRSCM